MRACICQEGEPCAACRGTGTPTETAALEVAAWRARQAAVAELGVDVTQVEDLASRDGERLGVYLGLRRQLVETAVAAATRYGTARKRHALPRAREGASYVEVLQQAASLGLLDAADRHDPRRASFLTYARWRMRNRVNREIMRAAGAGCGRSRAPEIVDEEQSDGGSGCEEIEEAIDRHMQIAFLDRALGELRPRLGEVLQRLRNSSTGEVAEALGVTPRRVNDLRAQAIRGLQEIHERPPAARWQRETLAAALRDFQARRMVGEGKPKTSSGNR